MRHPMIWAALLAGTACSPAMAQLTDVTVATEIEAQPQASVQPVAVEPVAMAGDQEQRRDRGETGDRRSQGMRAITERSEREARPDLQQPAQAESEAQVQAEPQLRRERMRERAENNDGSANRGWQQREMPVVNEPVAPVVQAVPVEQQINRNLRGTNDANRSWNRDDVRQAQVPGVPPTWQRRDRDIDNDGIRNNRDRDRDGDGIRNSRDWDRDGDGTRNNRDWDRNNDGRVDRRWDRNNNGAVDWRYDHNRDGVRGNDGNWNRNDRDWNRNNQHWGQNDRHWGQSDRHWGQQYGNNRQWNRGWRNDNRYDWQRYRSVNRNLYRAPRYYSPYGYNHRYQRFSIGIYLNQVFFGSRYRIDNPWQYRLPYADWPYEWVRYYDDVLLVDTRNGYIVDVIHGFFW